MIRIKFNSIALKCLILIGGILGLFGNGYAQLVPGPGKVDIRVAVKSYPDFFSSGQRIPKDVELEITYIGNKEVTIACDLVLSSKETYTVPAPYAVVSEVYKDGMLLKGGREHVTIAPSQPAVVKVTLWGEIPKEIVPGKYYLIAVVDAGNKVSEISEQNNFVALPVSIFVPIENPIWRSHGTRGEDNVVNLLNNTKGLKSIDISYAGDEGRGLYQLYFTINEEPTNSAAVNNKWGWKGFGTIEETFNFLNTDLTYDPDKIDIVKNKEGEGSAYTIFYQIIDRKNTVSWAWKRATSIEDAKNFLNANKPYGLIDRTILTGVKEGDNVDIIIFYQKGKPQIRKTWHYAEVITSKKGVIFLNGENSYKKRIKYAKVFSSVKDGEEHYHIFYGF